MNRICLFVLFISVITACNKTDLPENEDFKQNPQLTEAEAIVVARHFSGNTRNEPEAIEEAESVISFFDSNSGQTRSTVRQIKNIIVAKKTHSATRATRDTEAEPLAYIVNFSEDMGFAVISADRRTETILAMSDTGNIDVNDEDDDFPPALEVFFANLENMYETQIAVADEQEAQLLDNALSKLDANAENNGITTRAAAQRTTKYGAWEIVSKMPPLVKVHWGQRSPYNDNAPLINGERALAGCTATAIAQIMSYHCYPTSYNWTDINKFTYSWYASPSATTKTDIAKIFRTIGDNIGMKWGLSKDGGSGAYVSNAPKHFSKMGYKNSGRYGGYDFNRIITSTMNGIPVIMSGYAIAETYTYRKWFLGKKRKGTRYKEGHAWVIDGYLNRRRKVEIQENGKVVQSYYQYEQLVHCNYGWNGSKDGYYNNAAFDTNKGPVTRSGESYNYQFKLETLYDVKPY